MPGKATPVKVPLEGDFSGKFRIQAYDIMDNSERIAYESIRTEANRVGSGITIENIRDLQETEEVTDTEGNRTRTETWRIVVSWWDTKQASEDKADNVFTLKTGEVR